MSTAVDIFVFDDSVSPAPIVSATVGIFDPTTFAEIALATTDSLGRAAFMLSGSSSPGTNYEVRVFKLGVRFANPFEIAVIEPVVTTNKFDVSGTLLDLPAAIDPRVCRCSGRFLNFSNQPIVGATVRFMAKADTGTQVPKIVDGNLISAEVLATQTDKDGFVTVDLLRTAEYFVTYSGDDDVLWNIKVPDRTSMNLIELLFPQPVSLAWDSTDAPGNSVTITKGQTVNIHFTILYSDFENLSTNTTKWVSFTNSDDSKITLAAADGVVVISGVGVGGAAVSGAINSNLLPSRVPGYSITVPDLAVIVNP